MNPKTRAPFLFFAMASYLAVAAVFVGCREEKDGPSQVASPEASDLEIQLEIEREMLAVERELLELERVKLQEDRDAAVAESDAAKAAAEAAKTEAEQARQSLANSTYQPGGVTPTQPYVATTPPVQSGPQWINGQPGYSNTFSPSQTVTIQQPGHEPDYSIFYDELRPHGSWFETESYGYVWRPEVARRDPNWRPYTDGRWIDSDLGWTWWSDEPFGWATFHYGRWTIVRNVGWIWIPGRVWAPAWVSWRESRDHIGWAPLPPVTLYESRFNYGSRTDSVCGIPDYHYNFVPSGRFAEPVHRHCLPPSQNVQIIRVSVNITNIHVHNETVIVNGPRPDQWRERFGRDRLPHHTIQRDDWREGNRDRSPRENGSVLNFVAPTLVATSSKEERPDDVAGRLGGLIPEYAAAKADSEIVKNFARGRAREEVLAEATVVPGNSQNSGESGRGLPGFLNQNRSAEEIRKTIAEREERIEELKQERNEVIAEAEVKAEMESQSAGLEPVPNPQEKIVEHSGDPHENISRNPAGQPGENTKVEHWGDPHEKLKKPGDSSPVEIVTELGESRNGEPGQTQSSAVTEVGGRDTGKSELETRMDELKKRQEELFSRGRNGDKPGTSAAVDPIVVPVTSEEGSTPVERKGRGFFGLGFGKSDSAGEPVQSVDTPPADRLPASGGSNEISKAEQEAMQAQQQRAQDQAREAAEAANRMKEAQEAQARMQAEQQRAQEQAREAAEAASRMREAQEAQGKMQAEQQRAQDQAREAAEAANRMKEAQEAQARMQAEQQRAQEQAREAAEAASRMREAQEAQARMQAEQQRAQEQAREAAEEQSRMRMEQQRAQDQAREAADIQDRLRAARESME